MLCTGDSRSIVSNSFVSQRNIQRSTIAFIVSRVRNVPTEARKATLLSLKSCIGCSAVLTDVLIQYVRAEMSCKHIMQ